jgi:Tfp pilus assembly protein FimT
LITIAIAAILITVAAPSFTNLISGSNTDSAVRRLANSFAYARSEALTRGITARVCATTDGVTCNAATDDDWNQGWIVVDDANVVLKVEDVSNLLVTVEVTDPVPADLDGLTSVCFDSVGEECNGALAFVTFTVTSNGVSSAMTLNRTGAVRVL